MSERLLGKQPQFVQMQCNAASDSDQDVPDPFWGNNCEASASTHPPVARCFSRMEMINLEVERVDQVVGEMELQISANMDMVNHESNDHTTMILDGMDDLVTQGTVLAFS